MTPKNLLYAKTHEWVRRRRPMPSRRAKIATVGFPAFALEALTDLVFIDLPAGRPRRSRPASRSARSNRSRPSATCTARSTARSSRSTRRLPTNLEHLADDPYGDGWLVKIRIADDAGLAQADGLRGVPEAVRGGGGRVSAEASDQTMQRRKLDRLGRCFIGISNHDSDLPSPAMPYIPNTPDDQRAMLEAIGAASLDELFAMVPAELRLDAAVGPAAGAWANWS